jgi:diguanylate cyclase (GGDEF)-like protein/PAS domain S-box-containing protein
MMLKNKRFLKIKLVDVICALFFRRRDEVSKQIEVDQFRSWVQHSYIMYPVGILGMIALLLDFRPHWQDIWIRVSTGCLVLSYATIITVGWTWTRSKYKDSYGALTKVRLAMGCIRFGIGSSWGGLLFSLMSIADPNQRALLYGTGIALMSTGIFGGSVIYGLTFWLPVTLGCCLSVISSYNVTGPTPLICLVLYGILTSYSIFYLSNKVRALAVSGFELKSRDDIISLILNDFEEDSSDWLWETDSNFILKNISERFKKILGLTVPRNPVNLRTLLLANIVAATDESDMEILNQRLLNLQPFRKLTVAARIGGGECWWLLSGKPRFDRAGVFLGYHGMASDVTESHGFRQRLDYVARCDVLTGLYNRAHFNDSLDRMFHASPDAQEPFCLISIDLDNFKGVNDTYGHGTGDELLSLAAERIRAATRDEDVAARLGGDEFCLILPYGSQQDGELVASRIIESLNKPFFISGFRIVAGASAGIAYGPRDGSSAKELLKRADIALYQAKSDGRGTYRSYNRVLEQRLDEQKALEADLRLAMDRDELVIYFQPIFSLATEAPNGVEALVRWRHPTKGLLSPNVFMEIAESTGLIETIGEWVIIEACRLGKYLPTGIRISINLSPLQLRNQKLPSLVKQVIDESKIAPSRIEFEITESAILETSGQSSATLQELKSLGVRLALDDFGTGHSSLSLLRRFRFDRVKIDKSFTSGLATDKTDKILVDQIIEMSKKLGMDVTVEGIETDEQAQYLKKYNGISVQGHLYGRADKPEAFEKFLPLGLSGPCPVGDGHRHPSGLEAVTG